MIHHARIVHALDADNAAARLLDPDIGVTNQLDEIGPAAVLAGRLHCEHPTHHQHQTLVAETEAADPSLVLYGDAYDEAAIRHIVGLPAS